MATTNNEKIDAYLSGDLPGEDKAAFDRQLAAEADLNQEVRLWQEIDQILEDEATVNFQQQVLVTGQAFLKQQQQPTAKVRKLSNARRNYLAIAATVLLLVTTGLLLLNNPFASEFSGKDLYATNFETYDLDATRSSRSADETPTVDFATGVAQYQAKEFSAAATTFEALLASDKGNMAVTFALAQAQLNLNPPDLTGAGNLLQQVIADGKSAYVLSSQWYLALVKIQQEQPKEAIKLLEVVQQRGGAELREKATDLLQTLQ